MPHPTKYTRQYDYQSYQNANPTRPLPGHKVNADFNAVQQSIDEIVERAKLIQRDDGHLANGVVGFDALSPELQTNGLAPASQWVSGNAYKVGDAVVSAARLYRCVRAHVARSIFHLDLSAGYWTHVADLPVGPAGPQGVPGSTPASVVIAHRGFALLAPENTMTAYRNAYSLGCRNFETDVQISSDGVPVLIHDATVDRTTDGTGNVKDLTLSDLQALDAGSFRSALFADTRIPTFAELVAFAKSVGGNIYAEVKGYRTQADIDLMLDVVDAAGMQNYVYWSSSEFSDIEYIRARSDIYPVGSIGTNISLLSATAALGGTTSMVLQWDQVLANPGWVADIAAAGVGLEVWTPNRFDYIQALQNIGVRKFMSDLNHEVA